MPTFKILYSFDGQGHAILEATNKDEAREKFYDGECTYKDNNGQYYVIDSIEET